MAPTQLRSWNKSYCNQCCRLLCFTVRSDAFRQIYHVWCFVIWCWL